MALGARIAILAGCLEPGHDGVGDYSRALAIEARSTKTQVILIALADKYVSFTTHEIEENGVTIRLPATMEWAARIVLLKAALDNFDPDWISLQFVPYSFHQRGWVHRLSHRLTPLLARTDSVHMIPKTRSLHIMFHELWLGTYSQAPWRHCLEGFWQRHAILSFIRSVRPAILHTTNTTYQQALRKHRVEAECLPLFGNIPIIEDPADQNESDGWWNGELQKMSVSPRELQGWWIFGVFGSIHSEWWPGDLFDSLLAMSSLHGRRLALVTVGRPGPSGPEVIQRLKRAFKGRLSVRELGEQPPARVATVFRHLDFGIATSPWELIGKSGSAAAMRDHGVPVIVTRTGRDRAEFAVEDPMLLRFNSALATRLHQVRRQPARSRRASITKQWLESLQVSGMHPVTKYS